ncbi:hypothetical protein [Dyadobacter frigoris]|uniref:hypothetical protein n=1 Tax=Dyadobacter frigoris TaxID=2576211 RepID=UPI0025575B2C|nr:hypothetical protein [Dyadobacter frigoris]
MLNGVGYCQPSDAVYASSQTNGNPHAGISSASVDNPQNAITNTISNTTDASFTKPNAKFTTLKATALSTLTGSASAWIQLAFVSTPTDAVVPANTTVYVKATTTAAGLLGLVGGAGLTFTAYSTNTGTANPVTIAAAPKIYYTADGNIYFAVKPTANFKSIRITLAAGAVLGDGSVDIYYAFYGPGATNDTNPFPFNVADCGLPNVDETESSGAVTLASFVSPGSAIDNSLTSATAFSITASIAGTMKQTFYFNGLSNAGDAVRIIFSKGSASALASIDIGSSLTIQAFNGAAFVGTATPFNELLSLNLLSSTLLGTSTNSITAYLTPKDAGGNPAVFDRVVVTFNVTASLLGSLLSGSANGFNIFDVRRVPIAPASSNITACTNIGIATLAASTTQSAIQNIGSFTYKWYSVLAGGSGTGGQNLALTGLTAVGQSSYYVDIQKSGCESSSTGSPSSRTKVTVNVVNPPVTPSVALTP